MKYQTMKRSSSTLRDTDQTSGQAPEISIIIVSYQCRRYLLSLLRDLSLAREAIALEVHVVDNDSDDDSVASVRRLYPWVVVTALEENVGFGRANNMAISGVQAETVLLQNPDTHITTQALRACIDEIRRSPDIGILTPRVVDERGVFDRRCMRGFPTLWGVFCHVSGLDRFLRDRRSLRYTVGWLEDDREADVEAVSGAVMFCRRDALRQIGGFDERFFMYGEDIDLCLRVRAAGWRVRYWPGAEVMHLGGRSGMHPHARRAWARSIGDLHRFHRGRRGGRVSGAICDLAGMALGVLRRESRPSAPGDG